MAITEAESGTITTSGTPNTEERLNTTDGDTTDGVYQFFLDLNDLAANETLTVRVYEKIISSGTMRVIFYDVITGDMAANDEGWVSPSLILMHGWKITTSVNAASVSIPWSIRKVA
jgi:hypothetical protein